MSDHPISAAARGATARRVLLDDHPLAPNYVPAADFSMLMGQLPAWVAPSTGQGERPAVLAFRLRFTMAEPGSPRIHVSADERFDLWLDGERIGRGPERARAAPGSTRPMSSPSHPAHTPFWRASGVWANWPRWRSAAGRRASCLQPTAVRHATLYRRSGLGSGGAGRLWLYRPRRARRLLRRPQRALRHGRSLSGRYRSG